jgi:hypothetical protein
MAKDVRVKTLPLTDEDTSGDDAPLRELERFAASAVADMPFS